MRKLPHQSPCGVLCLSGQVCDSFFELSPVWTRIDEDLESAMEEKSNQNTHIFEMVFKTSAEKNKMISDLFFLVQLAFSVFI